MKMKLKDFIVDVIVEIQEGIKEASTKTSKKIELDESSEGGIEFDVALTVGEEASGKLGAEVFSIGAKAEGQFNHEQVSRVKFKVYPNSYT